MYKFKMDITLDEHLQYVEEHGEEIDFRDLYNYHHDIWIKRAHEETLPMDKMSSDHIANSINFIQSEGPLSCYGLGALWYPKLMRELKRRGRIDFDE